MKKQQYYKPKAKHVDFDVAILRRDMRDNYILIFCVACGVAFSFFLGYLVGKTDEAVALVRPQSQQITLEQEIVR